MNNVALKIHKQIFGYISANKDINSWCGDYQRLQSHESLLVRYFKLRFYEILAFYYEILQSFFKFNATGFPIDNQCDRID